MDAATALPWSIPEPTGNYKTHHALHVIERHRPTAVTELLDQCIAAAAARGLALYCFRERLDCYHTTSWFAAHPQSQPEPLEPAECQGPQAVLLQREGSTARCEAYRELSKLLQALQAQ